MVGVFVAFVDFVISEGGGGVVGKEECMIMCF